MGAMAHSRRSSRRNKKPSRPSRACSNKLLQEEAHKHGEPFLGPCGSLLLIILLTALACTIFRIGWTSLSGWWWADGLISFVLSALLVSSVWSANLQTWCQEHERTAQELADSDSKFGVVGGMKIHHKVEWGHGGGSRLIHMYHGFGANLWTWDDVQHKLAMKTSALVTAHDMPGFGLSDRPQSIPAYSLLCNGSIGRIIMELQLPDNLHKTGIQALDCSSGLPSTFENAPSPPTLHKSALPSILHGVGSPSPEARVKRTGSSPILAYWGQPIFDSGSQNDALNMSISNTAARQASRQRILVGHSMGCACAVLVALSDPASIDALVLVAPAIPAVGFPGSGLRKEDPATSSQGSSRHGSQWHLEASAKKLDSGQQQFGTWVKNRGWWLADLFAYIVGRLGRIGVSLVFMFLSVLVAVFQPWLLGAARFVGRSERFWNAALHIAFHQRKHIKKRLWAYRRPLYMQGWEKGLIPFLLSWLSMDGMGVFNDLIDAFTNPAPRTLAQRLSEMVKETGTRVLIVQGTADPLIPKRHGRDLAAMIPGAQLLEYSGCGHNPQEECPGQFVEDVGNFVNGIC